MPHLRSLFDLSRRLLPGRSARMQGYGDQRAMAGIRVNGINGALTLSRSDKSGLVPNLSGEEMPLELHAGSGVRLHGHGNMQRLEILPVAVAIEEEPLGPARLEWEIETFKGNATICALGESLIDPGNWVIIETTVQNFEFGSYTDTVTASGVVSSYAPSDPPPPACDEPVIASTQDDEFEYGNFESSEYSETLEPFSSLASPAIAAVGLFGSSGSYSEWTLNNWHDISTGVIPFSVGLGVVSVFYDVTGAEANAVRFRLHNRGSCALRVNCGHYGSGLTGGASDLDQDIFLARNESTSWIEAPTIDTDPLKFRNVEIRRVRIGRYRIVT